MSRHTEFCKADCTTWKLTLQDINTTPKEPKTERGRSRRQLFRAFWGSSVRRNEQRGSAVKYRTLCFKALTWTQTLTESRHITCHREDKSPSVTLMSHKENIGWTKPTLETWAKPCKNEQHIGSFAVLCSFNVNLLLIFLGPWVFYKSDKFCLLFSYKVTPPLHHPKNNFMNKWHLIQPLQREIYKQPTLIS